MDNSDLQAISKMMHEVMQEELKPVKTQISGLETRMDKLETDVTDITGLKSEVSGLKLQANENTKILKSLEEASRVHKVDIDNLTNQVASLLEDVKEIKTCMNDVEIITSQNWNDIAKLKAVKYI